MQQFAVDDDVVDAVWQLAKPRPFENLSFSSALRRVLGFSGNGESAESPGSALSSAPITEQVPPTDEPTAELLDDLIRDASNNRARSKAPKADLRELIRVGLLQKDEELFLVDYRGARLQQFKATISSGGLLFDGQHYSMSDLARQLLKKVGYESDSVRGPAHWANGRGVTVRGLWQQLLDKRSHK